MVLLLSDIILPWASEIWSCGGKQQRGCRPLTYRPQAWLSHVQLACAASEWATGFCCCQVEARVEGCLQMKVVPTHSGVALQTWVLKKREAQWMEGGGRMGTLGPGCREAQWGCHDGTGDAAATRTAARRCWTLGQPAQGWGGSGWAGPGRTCTRQVGRVGGSDEEFLAGSDMHPSLWTCAALVVCDEGGCSLWKAGYRMWTQKDVLTAGRHMISI